MSLPDDMGDFQLAGPQPPDPSARKVRDGRDPNRPGRSDLDVGHRTLNPPSEESG